ncbi:MAG: DegV family protein [Lachnospiraceae bacterium]|nr:DegV family protein [Lachnospiraceae bacterium]
MIKIISDSTCDLSSDILARYGISILPLHILLGEEEYSDSRNITPDQIFAWSDKYKTTPKTSAPSLDETVSFFRSFIKLDHEIIAFSISESMSSSNQVMHLAAQTLEAEDRISVIDSKNLSTGIGLLVIEAAVMAAEGKSRAEIVSRIEHLVPLVRASFVVDTLTFLHRGGRCSGLAALAGSVLQLHPRIFVADGTMSPGKKYRGSIGKASLEYAKDMEEDLLHAKKDRVFVTHTQRDENVVLSVKRYLEELDYFDEILTTHAGGVVSSHCGPGTLGVLFIAGE